MVANMTPNSNRVTELEAELAFVLKTVLYAGESQFEFVVLYFCCMHLGGGASPSLYIHVEKIETFSISSPYSFLFSVIKEKAVYVLRISRQRTYFKPQNFGEK